jgi:hypothetical protein
LVVKDFSVYPPAAEILVTAQKSGIYNYQDLPLYTPEELSPDKLQPTTQFTGEIKSYHKIPQGDYQIGILVEHSDQQALQWLDEVVKK